MSIAMDIMHKGFTSSSSAAAAAAAAAEVGDNFDTEFFRPCSMKEEDASDAESGVYKTMMAHDEGETEDEACSSLVRGVVFVNKCSSQVYRMSTWASSSDEEEDIVEGDDEEQEERSVLKDKRDPREEDRAFWKACLAHGYP